MALISALVITSIAAGCGSSDDSLTKAEYVKEVNVLCEESNNEKNEAIKAAGAELSKNRGNASNRELEEKLITDSALPPIKAMTEELAELELPSEGEAEAQAIVEGFEKAVKQVEENPASATTSGGDPFEAVNNLSQEFGLVECSRI